MVDIDLRTAQRMGAATLYVENMIKVEADTTRRNPKSPRLGNFTAITQGTISAADGRSYGSGTAMLVSHSEDHTMEDIEEITVYNRYAGEVEDNTVIAVSYNGYWHVEGSDCSSLEEEEEEES